MANINDLDLSDEQIPEVDLDNLPPDGFEMPQPGQALFTLPSNMEDLWEKIVTDDGERLKANFKKQTEGDFRLTYQRGEETGKLALSLTSREFGTRPSKLAYLLGALGFKGTFNTNQEIADALKTKAGKQFIANITYSATNKNNGNKFSTRPYVNKKTGIPVLPIPKDQNGKMLHEFMDEGSLVRAWPDLESFRPTGGAPPASPSR